MTGLQSWADMFRAHTCFKALVAMSDQMVAGVSASLTSERVPPCRACRAWWARCCAAVKASVSFTWPGGTWSIPGRSLPFESPHNQALATPELRSDGMAILVVENQGCALWAQLASDPSPDPEVYQSDLGDEDYGPWLPVGMRRSEFLAAMDLWNQANGGVLPSAVGEVSGSTAAVLRDRPVVSSTPCFTVYQYSTLRVCCAGQDAYVWGGAADDVRRAIRELQLRWSDLEY